MKIDVRGDLAGILAISLKTKTPATGTGVSQVEMVAGPDVHPNIAEHYRAKVIRLAETLAEPEVNGEAREDIRSLIGEVVITPGEKRGESHAILRGELVAILDLAAGRRRTPTPEVITMELAGPRFEPIALRHSSCGGIGSACSTHIGSGGLSNDHLLPCVAVAGVDRCIQGRPPVLNSNDTSASNSYCARPGPQSLVTRLQTAP